MTQVDCEIIKTFITTNFPQFPNIDVSITEKFFQKEENQIILRMVNRLIQGPPTETKEYKYPKDWWNAVKERFFSRWLTVEYTTIKTYIRYNVCPHIDVSNTEKHIRFIMQEPSKIDFDSIAFFEKGPFKYNPDADQS